MEQSNNIPLIVNKYLQSTGLSMRKFGTALGTNHASISNWAAGKSVPSIFFLLNCRENFNDWRLRFATEILNIMVPTANIFSPETVLCDECGQPKVVSSEVSAGQSSTSLARPNSPG
jgi:transcriptional regulator with XRE-family HTH domain